MSKSLVSKGNELPPVRERAAYLGLSAVILLFVKMYLSVFPLDDYDKLGVLIWSRSEVSLHINFPGTL